MSVTESDATFEAYSHRVSARFGSRVQIAVGNNTVSITGPRLSPSVNRSWIAVQAVLLTLIVLALLGTLIFWDWRGLIVALFLLLTHLAVGGSGAGCLWQMANLTAFIEGATGETVSFPLDSVRRIKVGSGWARRGHVAAHIALRCRHQQPC
ncbi:MAG: hypothetical protein GWN58_37005 [Anaerolineae bacterium]|nr:hypothetical protein [Anaerolineae bacterium]